MLPLSAKTCLLSQAQMKLKYLLMIWHVSSVLLIYFLQFINCCCSLRDHQMVPSVTDAQHMKSTLLRILSQKRMLLAL
jgi:hypothetical protein